MTIFNKILNKSNSYNYYKAKCKKLEHEIKELKIKNSTLPTTPKLNENYHSEIDKKTKKEVYQVSENYWESQEDWHINEVFRTQHYTQIGYMVEEFLPYIEKKMEICDLACASGNYSFLIADKAKHIDGFDLSPGLIKKAIEMAKNLNIKNVSFEVGDANKIEFKKKYDAFIVSGLFTYIIDENDVNKIIKKIYNALNNDNKEHLPNVVLVKDTLMEKTTYYKDEGYGAVYRSKKDYMKLWEDNGFELINEVVLMEREFGYSFGGIFKKK